MWSGIFSASKRSSSSSAASALASLRIVASLGKAAKSTLSFSIFDK
jgi:hypothetical protein